MFQMMLELMPIIEKMRWSWLVSEEEPFATSDHPIALVDDTAKYYFPGFMSSANSEFTFPLSRQVCLRGSWKGREQVSIATPATVRQINKRTITWARKYVYAPQKSLKLAALADKILSKTQNEPLV
jgi:hypothetical protein